jgi:uncharacterized protein (UPF0276 family)
MGAALGFTLQPEERFLALTAELLDLVDYVEVTPETLWRSDASGAIVPNGFHERFAMLKRESGLAFVAHGVGFSVGTARPDAARRARWLERIAADHEVFEFGWYTDHLGVTELAGRNLTLPLAVPLVPAAARAVETSLRALQSAVPDTGFETSAFYFHLGDPLAEPTFVRAALAAPRTHLLLDLHNVWTNARNLGFEAGEYLERLPLERVIEIHLSGGTESDPAWLPSRAILRLDSHDHAVPEEVWQLAERFVPRCTNLRGLTLERMEGTVGPGDVAPLRAELLRARALLERLPQSASSSSAARSAAQSIDKPAASPRERSAPTSFHAANALRLRRGIARVRERLRLRRGFSRVRERPARALFRPRRARAPRAAPRRRLLRPRPQRCLRHAEFGPRVRACFCARLRGRLPHRRPPDRAPALRAPAQRLLARRRPLELRPPLLHLALPPLPPRRPRHRLLPARRSRSLRALARRSAATRSELAPESESACERGESLSVGPTVDVRTLLRSSPATLRRCTDVHVWGLGVAVALVSCRTESVSVVAVKPAAESIHVELFPASSWFTTHDGGFSVEASPPRDSASERALLDCALAALGRTDAEPDVVDAWSMTFRIESKADTIRLEFSDLRHAARVARRGVIDPGPRVRIRIPRPVVPGVRCMVLGGVDAARRAFRHRERLARSALCSVRSGRQLLRSFLGASFRRLVVQRRRRLVPGSGLAPEVSCVVQRLLDRQPRRVEVHGTEVLGRLAL